MISFSFCLITKNEEKHISRCLSPLKETGMEIIILDTGSSDRTIEIAKEFTSHIYHFEWIHDFSAARNYAMSKASNDYVLFLDADEYVEEINISAIQKLIGRYPDAIGQITRRNACYGSDGSEKIMIDRVERLFNRNLYCYTGKIHEQVTHRMGKELTVYQIPLTAYHIGYLGTPEERRQKAERNNELLFEELASSPDDPYIYYQLGQSYGLIGDAEQEYTYYHKGCSLPLDTTLEYVKIMLVSYGYSMLNTNRAGQALQLADYYDKLSSYADYACLLGNIYIDNNELLKAIHIFRHALTLTEYHVEGTVNASPWHNLGCIYESLGNTEDALFCYKKAMEWNSPCTKDRYDSLLQNYTAGTNGQNDDNVSKYIAILIPCYNASGELDGLFHTLEQQTMGLTHTELIFLDLASKDNTWNKLNQFEQKYPDSVMLFHFNPEDLPYPAASSIDCIAWGIADNLISSYITAPYVCFMEPGHRINMDLFRQFHSASQGGSCDIVLCHTTDRWENEYEFSTHVSKDASYSILQIDNEAAHRQIAASPLFANPVFGKLFSVSYLKGKNVWNLIDSATGQNPARQILTARTALSAGSIYYIADTLYYCP